jgi:hypothetical protein
VDAALAFGAATGMPISLVAGMRTAETHLRVDAVLNRAGLCIGMRPRLKGRKVHRRRLTIGTHRTYWLASASRLVESHVAPWVAVAKRRGSALLFPAFTADGTAKDRPVSLAVLRAAVESVRKGAQWHDLRRGFERALEMVHLSCAGPGVTQHPSMPSTPVPGHVRNWITMRSNREELGSRSDYVSPVADAMFAATRWLHLVKSRTLGGLALGPEVGAERTPVAAPPSMRPSSATHRSSSSPSASPEIREAQDIGSQASGSVRSAAMSVECLRCGGHISRHRRGTWCSEQTCSRAVCRKCHPVLTVSMRCVDHPAWADGLMGDGNLLGGPPLAQSGQRPSE